MDYIKTKKWFLLNIIAFYALLSYGYYFFFYIFQNFSTKIGFQFEINYFKLVEGLIVILLVALFYVFNDINKSVYLTYTFIFYVFIIVPSSSYYFMSNNSRAYFYMQVLSIVILNLFYILNIKFDKNRKNEHEFVGLKLVPKKINLAMAGFLGVIGLFMLSDVLIYMKYGHSLLYLFKLDKVYDIRIAARAQVPSKLSYIISWSAMVIVPASIAWIVKIKKYYLIVIPIFVQILIFTIGGTKSHIFTLVLVGFIFILYTYKKMDLFIPCLNLLLAGTLLLKNAFIMAVVIRRAFFFPQSISYSYYDFFTKYPQLKLSNSIFRHIFVNHYKLDAPFIISRYVYKTPVMSANTNFMANAFANYGLIGIISFSIVLAIILIMIERISSNGINKRYVILITFCSFYALVNSALFTTMLTHGLLFSVLLAFVFYTGLAFEHRKNRL